MHRRLLLGAVALGFAGLRTSLVSARPPQFVASGGGQFMELDPREDVSAIQVSDFAGRSRRLAAYRGKPALVAFWASWCPPCAVELPILKALQSRERELGISVVPISLDREPSRAKRFIERLGLSGFSSFIDKDAKVASGPKSDVQTPFALYGMPMTYILDAKCRTAGHLAGAADWSTPEAIRLIRHFA